MTPEVSSDNVSAGHHQNDLDTARGAPLVAREPVGRARAEAAGELLRHLQALADAARIDADLDDLLHDLLQRVRAVLHAESMAILLPTEDGHAFGVRSALDDKVAAGIQVSVDWGLVGRTLGSRQPVRVGNRYGAALSAPRLRGIRVVLGVPLLIEGRAIGVLQIGTCNPHRFGASEVLLLQLTANRMALVIEKAAERRARAAVEAAHARSALLAETSALLDGSLDWESALASVARLAVPRLGDCCVVDVLEPDYSVRRLAVACADSADAEVASELPRRAPQDPSEARASESVIEVPLVARGHTLGAVIFMRRGASQRYEVHDVEVAREVAHRMAMALDNARLYQATQRAVNVRDQFLALASHDLRTPLSHIKGFTTTLLQTEVDEDSRREFLVEIERATDRLDKLIGDLLDLSRIDSGGLDSVKRSATRPAVLVAGGLQRVRSLLGERVLRVDVPAELPLVAVDVTQMERVVANLVENASKYSPSDGVIRVQGRSRGSMLEMTVEDDGPGIPPEELDRIFEKFYRVSGCGTSGVTGTGLGLAICRGIVCAHGGRVWAENRAEVGARFVVVLPVAKAAADGERRAAQ